MSYYSGVYSIFHRFIKDYVDSLQPDKTNRYVYCYNNPINLIDPLGLSPDEKMAEDVKDQKVTPEKKGDTKPQVAGQPHSPPQEGQTAADVKQKEGVQQQTVAGNSGVEKCSDHREQIRVDESGAMTFTVSDKGKSDTINLGKDPGVSIGKSDTQVAQGSGSGTSVPAGVKGAVVGTLGNIGTDLADKGLEKGASRAARRFGKAGGIGLIAQGIETGRGIIGTLRDPDTSLSGVEKASLISLRITTGAATVTTGLLVGGGTLVLTKHPWAGVAAGGASAAVVAEIGDWGTKQVDWIYRHN